MSDASKRSAAQGGSWLPIALVLLLLVAGLGFLLWYFALSPQEPAISFSPPAAEQPTRPEAESYPPPTAPGPERLAPPSATAPPVTVPSTVMVDETKDQCEIIREQLGEFFRRLDGREYIRQRELDGGSRPYFGRLLDRLLAQPPVVSGETGELYAILNNTAHFYRVLGSNDLWLLKEVLRREREDLEEILALFHQWSVLTPDCPADGVNIHLPLPAIYEYAGFFLETLGGRSYLFRRDAPVRLLATYYSVLTLDRANEAGINRHGLDIRPAIDGLRSEIPGATALEHRQEYLATLTELADKYRRRYGQ